MTEILVDPRILGAAVGLLFGLFLAVFLIIALSPWPKRKKHPEVIGVVRKRCHACEDGWSIGDMGLCSNCQRALDDASGRST